MSLSPLIIGLITLVVSIGLIGLVIWLLLISSPIIYMLLRQLMILYARAFGGKKWSTFLFPFLIKKYKYVQENKSFNSEKPHIALILANKWFPESYLIYGINIDKLVRYLQDRHKPYKVYDGLNANQIKSIINRKEVKAVLIFGHGNKHSVQTGSNESLYYCELMNSPKKYFLAQFHCNHFKGKSLEDYISKKDTLCFITDALQTDSEINKQIDKIIKDNLI